MPNDAGDRGRRGPLPGWERPPGPPGGPATGPPAPWGTSSPWAPPPAARFGTGALVGVGIGGLLAGVILTWVGLFVLREIVPRQAEFPAVGRYGTISEEARPPEVGDCLSAQPSLADVTDDEEVVPCTDRHRSEVLGIVEIPDLASPPTDRRLDLFTSEACSLAFGDHTGRNPDTTELDFGAVVPDADAWAAGERRAWCLVDSSGSNDGVGSLRRQR